MLLLLNAIGSVASIMGVSITFGEMLEKVKKSKKTSLKNEIISALLALQTPIESWKKIHQKYHGLSNTMYEIDRLLTNGDGTKKRRSDIAPNDLKKAIGHYSVKAPISEFKKELKPCINQIKELMDNRDTSTIENIDPKMKQWLESIVNAEKNIINNHNAYTSFFDQIIMLLKRDDWSAYEVDLFLDKRELFNETIYEIIYDTDCVLMSLLGIHIQFLNEAKGAFL